MARPKGIPGYLHHKASGRAYVRLNGTDIYLGFWGSKESKAEYDRIITEWLANGRLLPAAESQAESVTVNGLCKAYLDHAKKYYRKDGKITSEFNNLEIVCDYLHEYCGMSSAKDFTWQSLEAIRDKMVATGWKRDTVNRRVSQIKRVFKWADAREMIPSSVYHNLHKLEGLKKWRSDAPESEPILPVEKDVFEKTLPLVPPVIADMARLQYLAAMWPGEICSLRPCDLNRSSPVWEFDYKAHKTAHHGHNRSIWFGPKAQAILTPYLIDAEGDLQQFLFSPRESIYLANVEKRKNRKSKVQPSQVSRAKNNPKKEAGNRYEVSSYRRALQYGVKKYNTKEIAAAKKENREPVLLPNWFPNQLRHLRATEIRARFGLEASQVILGHENADVTQIYAERDKQKGCGIMGEIG